MYYLHRYTDSELLHHGTSGSVQEKEIKCQNEVKLLGKTVVKTQGILKITHTIVSYQLKKKKTSYYIIIGILIQINSLKEVYPCG